jgi:hypothetical protein
MSDAVVQIKLKFGWDTISRCNQTPPPTLNQLHPQIAPIHADS